MTEGVGVDRGAVERHRLAGVVECPGVDSGDPCDPGLHPPEDLLRADVGGAVCVLGPSRQQPQLVPGGVREPLGHPGLLGADRRDEGGVAQREAPTHSLRLVVVVDQDRSAAFVDVEAVEVKAGDLTGASPGALEDLVGEYRLLSGPLAQHP